MKNKQIIGDPIVINGRTLSLSKAIRAGDFIFLTGQVPMKDGKVVVDGSIEDQTVIVLEEIKDTLKLAGSTRRLEASWPHRPAPRGERPVVPIMYIHLGAHWRTQLKTGWRVKIQAPLDARTPSVAS